MKPFLTARWEHLLMLNYEIDPGVLQAYIPHGVELDDFHRQHFASIVGFVFRDTRLRGHSIPCHRNFTEVNLRFYVRRHEAGELRRGVVFLKEVVPLRAVAWVANRWYDEKYVVTAMSHTLTLPSGDRNGKVEYRWAGVTAGAEFTGEPSSLKPGTLEEFIAEHYWGYTRRRDGSTSAYQVKHPSWHVWHGKRHWLDGDVERFYGQTFAATLAQPPASVFVADGSAVEVYQGKRLDG